ncbi:hypothetical protein ABTP02_06575 [Acinetobacter baumannii]
MTIQTVNLGTAPTGAGGDTFRSTGAKINENFTNNTHAASRYVGTAAGNLMEVGAFGWGVSGSSSTPAISGDNESQLLSELGGKSRLFSGKSANSPYLYVWSPALYAQVNDGWFVLAVDKNGQGIKVTTGSTTGITAKTHQLWTTQNTTVDANGFIKAASPIIKLFADKIEPNDEAAEQNITFEKLDVGHYLLKGTSGFATEGWYIETPKDANGNILFAVIYQQLENKDIEIKTFKKKFDVESASIIADLDNPVDISTGRWIDIRLQEIPKPVPEMPVVTENDTE